MKPSQKGEEKIVEFENLIGRKFFMLLS